MNDTIQEFLDREKRQKSESVHSNRKSGLQAFDTWLDGRDLEDIGPLQIEDFVSWLTDKEGKDLTDGSAWTYKTQVSKLYKYLIKKRDSSIDENPVEEADLDVPNAYTSEREIQMKDGYRAIKPDEYDEIMANLPAQKSRNQLAFQLMWDCGLRPVEVCDIEMDDIDRQNREIKIRSNKTHETRKVGYGDKVATMLRIWLDTGEREMNRYAETSDKLLLSRQSERLSVDGLRWAFKKAVERSDLENETIYVNANGKAQKEYTLYGLRHGFGERMAEKVSIDKLRDMMGHSNISMTNQYLNPGEEERIKAHQAALDD